MRWITAGLLAVLCAGAVSAEEYKPGDKVVVVVDGNLTVSGSKVVDSVWPGLVLTVGDVNGEWLWLSNGKPGHLSRDKVIPLNRAAIDRLTELLKANPGSASLYSGRANVWKNLGELDIALGDYNEAIRLDPYSGYYNNRGLVWKAKQENDKALADYNEALRLDPKNVTAYNNRGNTWQDKQEYDKALADYNEALRLDPKYALAYRNRGNAWQAKQEYDKALADYNEALRLDPKDVSAAWHCGVTQLALRKKQAYIDFSDVLDIEKGKGEWSPYAVILGHLTARLLGDEPVAEQFLNDKSSQLPPAWPTPTVTFLRGQIDEPAYLALADTNDKQTEAHCYLGLKALADQQTEPARTHFEWVRDHGNKEFIEYDIAIAELKRLDQKTP